MTGMAEATAARLTLCKCAICRGSDPTDPKNTMNARKL